MKSVLFVAAMIASSNALAGDFYKCEPFAGVDEWRAGIDLSVQKAGFFDNDSTVVMNLVDTDYLETMPAQWKYTFEGENDGQGKARLVFNKTKLTATMYSLNGSEPSEIGTADCQEESEPWDLSDEE